MPPRKQLAHLEEARKLAHPDETTRLNAEQFTFSVIVEGLNFRAIERCMLWNNIIPPSAHMFYEVQAAMIPILISLARKSCDKWRASMAPGSIIALDGSWSHRRNAARCMVDFIDAERTKVVDTNRGNGQSSSENAGRDFERVHFLKCIKLRRFLLKKFGRLYGGDERRKWREDGSHRGGAVVGGIG